MKETETSKVDYSNYKPLSAEEIIHKQSKEELIRKINILEKKRLNSEHEITKKCLMTIEEYNTRLNYLIKCYSKGLKNELKELKEIVENKLWK